MLNPGTADQGFQAWMVETWSKVQNLEDVTIPLVYHSRYKNTRAKEIVEVLRKDGWHETQGIGSTVKFLAPKHHKVSA